MRLPPPLRKGDRIAIVAPSSPFDLERYRRGAAWLSSRYRLSVRDDLFARAGYLAGDDERRRSELADAMADPEVRAIVAARGGYGAGRICTELDWPAFSRAPKWIVGFSDVTALHVEAARVGVAAMHASMVASPSLVSEAARAEWIAALEGEAASRRWDGLVAITEGRAGGLAYGGNLALLEACAAAGRLEVPAGAVLFFEDCTERPYRIDRMLTSLAIAGHLARASAIVVGDFTDCPPGKDGVSVDDVLRARLSSLGVPVVCGAPFGHEDRNRPFVIGAEVEVVSGAGQAFVAFS